MNKQLYDDAKQIIDYSIKEVLPSKIISNALKNINKPKGKTIMIAIGKAAYAMAKETVSTINIDKGLVITKYNHSKEPLNNIEIIEAGHPLPDNNSLKAASKAIDLCLNLTKEDTVLMLISGGGSSLFESTNLSLEELQQVNDTLIKCGASINEINIIRKRLSKVKGGKFANICSPAKVINIVISDVIGDHLDIVASGPTYPDTSTYSDVIEIINKYNLKFNEKIMKELQNDTIKELNNIETYIAGNNNLLKQAAKTKAETLGYNTIYIEESITENIIHASNYLKQLIDKYEDKGNICIIAGGEIVVEVKGNGLGGRNMELACHIAKHIQNKNICMFSIGSDGTDGPTDAAGGYVDKDTYSKDIEEYLKNNDSYHYLEKHNGLIKTGPTGTNVCDLYCILIKQ